MPGKCDKLIGSLMAGRIQSIVQEARQIGTKVSIGKMLVKDLGFSARQNRIHPLFDMAL